MPYTMGNVNEDVLSTAVVIKVADKTRSRQERPQSFTPAVGAAAGCDGPDASSVNTACCLSWTTFASASRALSHTPFQYTVPAQS